MTELNDPRLVAEQYEDERGLAARRRVWNEFLEGPSSDDRTFEAVAEVSPRRVLEAGCGWGELSERIARDAGADVTAFDASPRMVRLARARGVRAFVGDLQALPFRDRSFDVVVANAMLYHVPDLDRGLAETARVLVDGGRLVATTFGTGHLREVWDLVGGPDVDLSFGLENGETVLAPFFGHIDARPGGGVVTFPDAREVRTYVASTITRSSYAESVPDLDGPFEARSEFAVFVARDPRRSPGDPASAPAGLPSGA